MSDKSDVDETAEFMRLFIRLTKEHHAKVTRATLVSSALLQALAEKMPDLYRAYERHLKTAEDSPLARTSRLIDDQLAAMMAKWEARAPKSD